MDRIVQLNYWTGIKSKGNAETGVETLVVLLSCKQLSVCHYVICKNQLHKSKNSKNQKVNTVTGVETSVVLLSCKQLSICDLQKPVA